MKLLPLVLEWRSGGTSWKGLSSALWYGQTIQTSLIFPQLNGLTPAKTQLHPTNLALITLILPGCLAAPKRHESEPQTILPLLCVVATAALVLAVRYLINLLLVCCNLWQSLAIPGSTLQWTSIACPHQLMNAKTEKRG